jgi:4-alpha-glucanotransferase
VTFPRSSGILLHVTSLPAPHGIGDLGDAAYQFVDFLERTGQSIWQILPLAPPAKGNSPYTAYSAFAGNPLLISLARLKDDGWLDAADLADAPQFRDNTVEYDKVGPFKAKLLKRAFQRFQADGGGSEPDAFSTFCQHNRWWLDDYALFMALTDAHDGADWNQWGTHLTQRDAAALSRESQRLQREIEHEKFLQYQFFRQWSALKAYANQRGIRILGDMPIFVAYESADVWSHQPLFHLDAAGRRTVVAGVPPDYFSAAGQLWGNPLYRWDALEQTQYAWWIARFRHAREMCDMLRLDHFRGFEAYWEVPADHTTAIDGRWVQGPGRKLFDEARRQLGDLPIVAEDLGSISPEVHQLRDELGFPGMRVLQFGFADDTGWYHQPHNFPRHCVVYTGTHDNDTAVGWFQSLSQPQSDGASRNLDHERRTVLDYTHTDGHEIHWNLIRLALTSAADTAVIPLQDILGLGSQARMNTPGTIEGNWRWRYTTEMLTPQVEQRLADLTKSTERRQP